MIGRSVGSVNGYLRSASSGLRLRASGSSMLTPPPHRDLLLRESPPVFGRPWFWQRGAGSMESTRSLAHVIMEMRDEIKKLEAENRGLRGDPGQRPLGGASGGSSPGSSASESPENPYGSLRRNASAPVLEGYKDNTVMTVRRYSVGTNMSDMARRELRNDTVRRSGSEWARLHEEAGNNIFPNSAKGEKVNNRRFLQEYVHKNRAKVKTVTFLLPVDDIYTNRPVLSKHLDDPKIGELDSITETES
ncbi:uncharacterized protein LOC117509125 [Thalassophryne amazonica]|uniref:uncharacterized protein LOC117509125 n=1 Tax=Thalassophryne amazonica TaxID=390379 RepID=UPI001471611C|nr:uncharacterized protein LOC117509125 [Thalassophryne amazonica]